MAANERPEGQALNDSMGGGRTAASLNLLALWFGRRDREASRSQAELADRTASVKLSLWALGLILIVAWAWSTVATAGFLGWDPHYYYSLLLDRNWAEIYPWEQTLFLFASVAHPWSFASYMFITITASLFILLVAFRRLGYPPLDQFVLIFFFSCSFYGLHFMVAFQRQFFGIVFFVLAIAGGRGSLLARVASIFSHLYAFTLQIFWVLGRLNAWIAAISALAMVAVIGALQQTLLPDTALHYGSYGENNPMHLLLKQSLTVLFSLAVLATVRRGKNALRSIAASYIALSIPVAIWPYYAGLFSRFDYFFFPIVVAFWPSYVREDRLIVYRLCVVALTIAGFFVWMNSNVQCEVMGYCEL
jgi:hypothetical protein